MMGGFKPPNFWIMGWVSTTVLLQLAKKIKYFVVIFSPGTNNDWSWTPNLCIVGWVFYHCVPPLAKKARVFFVFIFSPGTSNGCYQTPQLWDYKMSSLPGKLKRLEEEFENNRRLEPIRSCPPAHLPTAHLPTCSPAHLTWVGRAFSIRDWNRLEGCQHFWSNNICPKTFYAENKISSVLVT